MKLTPLPTVHTLSPSVTRICMREAAMSVTRTDSGRSCPKCIPSVTTYQSANTTLTTTLIINDQAMVTLGPWSIPCSAVPTTDAQFQACTNRFQIYMWITFSNI